MFFDLVRRNSRRSRKENGLFFLSLLISIIAFYIILSLSQQDVMRFLKQMESDAVNRLLTIVPVFYCLTLLIVFFLVYYASKYQLERRRHEFGVYLMMGMSRKKLFFLLLSEDLRSSLAALAVGLPTALFLSELTSLITARFVGIGILSHQISLSWEAVLWTAVGFVAVKLTAFVILSGKIAHQEIGDLLQPAPEGIKTRRTPAICLLVLLSGVLLLTAAYILAIRGFSWQSVFRMGLTLISGVCGTFLLFYGLRTVMDFFARRAGRSDRLHIFTFRQLEENVMCQSGALAVSSLLILAALCCFSCGAAMSHNYGTSEEHVLDYTFPQNEAPVSVEQQLQQKNLNRLFDEVFEIKTGYVYREEGDLRGVFSMESVMDAIRQEPDSEEKEIVLNNLSYTEYPRLISLSGYNRLLTAAGRQPLKLEEREAAVYIDSEMTEPEYNTILNRALAGSPAVELAGEKWRLTGSVQNTDIVVDRSITLSFALILSDEAFDRLTEGRHSVYWDGILSSEIKEDRSLMQSISLVNEKLDAAGIQYESYLQNMGRQLFYMVAISYLTIYLAVIFLITANTVIGVQFLTLQQRAQRRYRTLIRLGAGYEVLCRSAKRQIRYFFGIPCAVAAVSSIFGVRALFAGLLFSRVQDNMSSLLLTAAAVILLLCLIECAYVAAVARNSNRYLLSLMVPEREE